MHEKIYGNLKEVFQKFQLRPTWRAKKVATMQLFNILKYSKSDVASSDTPNFTLKDS